LPGIKADRLRLRQVLLNLLSNASKFSPEGGEITLSCSLADEGDSVLFAVKDKGIGIAPEDQDAVFEEFRQVDGSSTREQAGTGLGLAITKKLVELHGGDIWVESALGEGSTFFMTVPTAEARSMAAEEADAALAKRTAMVVEDDERVGNALCMELAERGFNTILVQTGTEAVQRARRTRLSLITLDIILPDKDGWQVLREIREEKDTRDVPVIVVSVTESRDVGLSLGADEYLKKPVMPGALTQALERLGIATVEHEASQTAIVVDDDQPSAAMAAELLRQEGYSAITLNSGARAVAMAAEIQPEVIVLDLMMMHVSGFEVARRLGADPETSAIPIIIFTVKDVTPSDEEMLAGRVHAIVQKGISGRSDLLSAIRGLPGRSPVALESVDEVGEGVA
jgi:DNA-binding response OmpR family regulator